jgi:hypothetical protein
MPKIAIRGKDVVNLGGWVLEHRAKLPYRDYVIGNPYSEPVKIEAPVYSLEGVKAIEELGLIVEPVASHELLIDKMKKVRAIIDAGPPTKEQIQP